MASITGNAKLVGSLIESGADPEQKDEVGRVPLFYSLINQHNAVTDILEKSGAKSQQLIEALIELPEWFKTNKQTIEQVKGRFSFCEFLTKQSNPEYGIDGDDQGILAIYEGDTIFYVNENSADRITIMSPHSVLGLGLSVGMTARTLFDKVPEAKVLINEISGHEGWYARDKGYGIEFETRGKEQVASHDVFDFIELTRPGTTIDRIIIYN